MKKLIDPSDDALNEAFAVHVAGWIPTEQQIEAWIVWARISGADDSRGAAIKTAEKCDRPHYTSSADAVLPWLEKNRFDCDYWNRWSVRIICWETHGENKFGEAETFSRAAVIALLRAHGVEIEFTK